MGANDQIDLGGSPAEKGEIKVRTIKLIGLTALAALTAMALVGASSAMAGNTALCKVDQVPCEAANQISHVHEETLTRAQGLLLSDPNVECIVLFLGDTFKAVALGASHHHVAATLANPLHILGTFSYSSCTNSCKVEEINGPADIIVLRTAHELAEITGEGEVKLTCAFGFIKCVYNGEGLLGHGLGPLLSTELKGETRVEEQTTKKVSGSCPATAKLDLLTTPLEHTYIST